MDLNGFSLFFGLLAAGIFVFAVIPLAFVNLYPLLSYKSPVTKSSRNRFDVILVLGFPASPDGKPSPIMRERVKKAAELFRKGEAGYIICSGGGVRNEYREADVMADFAESLGVPARCLLREDQSRDTVQNIQNSAKIMEDRKWSSAIVVTSPWHLRRTNDILSKSGLTYRMEKSGEPDEFSFFHVVSLYMKENRLMTKIRFKSRKR